VRALHTALDALDQPHPPLAMTCTNRIPHGRGLGSSAAAVVAGLLAGRALVAGGADRMDDEALLSFASAMEGHPDNAAACILGGLTLAWSDGAAVRAVRLEPGPDVRATVLVPDTELSTETARGLLPATVPHLDAAHAAGRAAVLVAALTGVPTQPSLLLAGTEDRLHQQYRASAMPATDALVRSLRDAGRAAAVSGAGPSVVVLGAAGEPAVLAPEGWALLRLDVARTGAQVISG
jgi:homoserine kinase